MKFANKHKISYLQLLFNHDLTGPIPKLFTENILSNK
jgi:hypothetical protein